MTSEPTAHQLKKVFLNTLTKFRADSGFGWEPAATINRDYKALNIITETVMVGDSLDDLNAAKRPKWRLLRNNRSTV